MPSLSELFEQVDNAYDEIVGLQQDLVRIPTVNTGFMPTGDETKACEFLSDLLAKEGIEGETIESAPGRGNYFATVKGSGGGQSMIYMAHTDVVPVETESEWICPPFSADIIGTRLYGRGSSDCKALLTCQTMAMIIMKRAGVELRGDLTLAACADEEAGGRFGVGWLAENHPDRLRADYCINEGGGDVVQRKGRGAGVPVRDRGEGEAGGAHHGERSAVPCLDSVERGERADEVGAGAEQAGGIRAGDRHIIGGVRAFKKPGPGRGADA